MSELNPKMVDAAYDMLLVQIRLGESIQQAQHTLANPTGHFVAPVPQEYINAAVSRYEKENDHFIEKCDLVTVINREKETGKWFDSDLAHDHYWPVVRESIGAKLGEEALDSIDKASSGILWSLRPPGQNEINRRGLVLGYVQSGKTTSFLSLIAKAADAGYRFFIILTGITNNLRKQTQLRIEEDLVNVTPQWQKLTNADEDFSHLHAQNAATILSSTENKVIAVVKKNGSVLKKLNRFLNAGGLATKNCPILVIDDEADQASINIGNHAKNEQSTINAQIKRLVNHPKVAYVAYTATPFANILINPNDTEDLYPRDFIHVLPKPKGYFGTESIFGRELLTGEGDEEIDDGLPITRHIPEDESLALQPRARQPEEEWDLYVPKSLSQAITWFILASAARRARNQGGKHSSMLVHTSVRTAVHEDAKELINGELTVFRRKYAEGALDAHLREIWNRESATVPASDFDLQTLTFEEVNAFIPNVLEELRVVTDNQKSTERLVYEDDKPSTVIAVGGNTLARGLTLEGLVVSYFVRNSSAYDTLLQMGRWFGFRPGYADLTRIWLTDELLSWFRDLAGVEADLRQELAKFASGNVTPLDYQARIRTSPYMEITSKAKAQELQTVSLSYSGQRVQTILFNHKDKSWLDANIEATRELSARILQSGAPQVEKDNGTVVFRGIHTDIITDFLQKYRFHEDSVLGKDASKKLTGYIDLERDKSISEWSVSFFGKKPSNNPNEVLPTIDLGLPDEVSLITRSQTHDSHEVANIKSLVGSLDRLNDFNRSKELNESLKQQIQEKEQRREDILINFHDDHVGQDVAHLAIYAIDKDSQAAVKSAANKSRKDLEAVEHMIGVGIFFPRAATTENTYDYVSAIRPDEELMDVYAEQEEEQMLLQKEEDGDA